MNLSVVIPVYNEVESLEALYWELDEVAHAEGYALEMIFVDDGSGDGSWRVICELANRDSRVRGIRFRRNFGKAAALNAGFGAATFDLVMTLDADLQDDPREIPKFLAKMEEDGLDLVSGWKKIRHDPWHKVLPSRVFNGMVSRLTGVKLHDHNCGMKCYRREIFKEVRLYGERHRFIPVLAHARGFRVGEIVINHRRRKFGRSKYGVKRLLKGFLDLLTVKFLTGYSQRPQHVLGTLGLICFLFGAISLTVLAALWLMSRVWEPQFGPPIHLHQRAVFFYSLGSLLLGGQLMTVGFLAELMTSHSANDADTYSVAEKTARKDNDEDIGP